MALHNRAQLELKNKKRRIYSALSNLRVISKMTLSADLEYNRIHLQHSQFFMPDFVFEWSEQQEHYRVYIHLADRENYKVRAGYSICSIKNGLAAMGFCMLYNFLHSHRANNKEAA